MRPWALRSGVVIHSAAEQWAWEYAHLTRVQRFLCDRGLHWWHRHAPWPPVLWPVESVTPEQAARWREVRDA